MAKLIIVFIMFLLAIGSELLKARKKKAVGHIPHKNTAAAPVRAAEPTIAEKRPQPRKPVQEPLFQEGMPSTVTVEAPKQAPAAARAVSREELRKAVIWSEILKPKF